MLILLNSISPGWSTYTCTGIGGMYVCNWLRVKKIPSLMMSAWGLFLSLNIKWNKSRIKKLKYFQWPKLLCKRQGPYTIEAHTCRHLNIDMEEVHVSTMYHILCLSGCWSFNTLGLHFTIHYTYLGHWLMCLLNFNHWPNSHCIYRYVAEQICFTSYKKMAKQCWLKSGIY